MSGGSALRRELNNKTFREMEQVMKLLKKIIHRSICLYLRKVGGAFHSFPYGPEGRYVVLMDESQYSKFKSID